MAEANAAQCVDGVRKKMMAVAWKRTERKREVALEVRENRCVNRNRCAFPCAFFILTCLSVLSDVICSYMTKHILCFSLHAFLSSQVSFIAEPQLPCCQI